MQNLHSSWMFRGQRIREGTGPIGLAIVDDHHSHIGNRKKRLGERSEIIDLVVGRNDHQRAHSLLPFEAQRRDLL
jgi:hypothetical protein